MDYLQGKSIHVSSKSNNRRRTRANFGNNSGFGKWVCVRDAKLVKFSAYKSTGVVLFEFEFWVFMDLPSY